MEVGAILNRALKKQYNIARKEAQVLLVNLCSMLRKRFVRLWGPEQHQRQRREGSPSKEIEKREG